jgi:thymidylate synthase
MRYFGATTADLVWQEAFTELLERPDHEHNGRNGVTYEILPCVLRIEDPRQRWVLSRRPPYNPAFGLVEFIWIITGNNESRVLNYWNPVLPKYSGTGDIYHGAYGFRLRQEFGLDQIERAYQVLSNAPETRQVILQIWQPNLDFPAIDGQPISTDIPCNVMSLLKLRDDRLYWSQIMRSNDIMRGLPYNIIQFTLLQEVMAGWLGSKLGDYFQLSDSLHVYEKDLAEFCCIPTNSKCIDREPFPLSYSESNELFALIYDDLLEVSYGNKKESEIREIFSRDSMRNLGRCELIKDMMAVIGSDAARRQNYSALAHYLADSCVDHNLKCASHAWLEYREGRK